MQADDMSLDLMRRIHGSIKTLFEITQGQLELIRTLAKSLDDHQDLFQILAGHNGEQPRMPTPNDLKNAAAEIAWLESLLKQQPGDTSKEL
jgi:hypothetical protein